MSEKDFLNQFSAESKKPESFKEEVRTPIHKEKKPVNKGLLIGCLLALIGIVTAVYFIFLAPKIVMPEFVGESKSDVAAWIKQQGIATSGIIFEEEYDFESEEGTILSQSVEAGKKVKENVKLNFVVSLGADPSESIKVPDIKTMEKAEIQEWISKNKLTKTKVTTSYSEAVEADKVISFEFTGCDEDSFTRSSTLKISVSKGPAPAGTITLEDFTGKTYAYVETWAKNKKINLTKTEKFSDTVGAELIITQSIAANRNMQEGETLEVVVSLGQGVKVPDLNTLGADALAEFIGKYGITVKEIYSSSSNAVVNQSIAAGKTVSVSDLSKMTITKNLGTSFYLADEGFTGIVGSSYNHLADLCNAKRSKGIDAYAGNWNESNEEYSYIYSRGTIVSVRYTSHSTGKEYYENDRMPLDIRFEVIVSKGKISQFTGIDFYDGSLFNKTNLIDALAAKGVTFSNHCTNDTCQLLVDGAPITVNGSTGNYSFDIIETQSVELTD